MNEIAGLAEICTRRKGRVLSGAWLRLVGSCFNMTGPGQVRTKWRSAWASKRTEGGLETLLLWQSCVSRMGGVAAAREIDNLRGVRLGVLGLGLREYLQSVCVGILPEDRLI